MKSRIEKERDFWNVFSNRYDSFIAKTLHITYLQLYKKIKEELDKNDRLLEVATGTGLVSFELCSSVEHITAIDIAPDMIRIAKDKQTNKNISNIEFEVGDLCNLAFDNDSFDKVLASNVLHLLIDPEKALSEISRVLKADGKAILPTFCHGENFKSRFLSFIMSFFGFKARNKWSVKKYCEFISSNGFEIIRSETIKGKIPLSYLVVKKGQ